MVWIPIGISCGALFVAVLGLIRQWRRDRVADRRAHEDEQPWFDPTFRFLDTGEPYLRLRFMGGPMRLDGITAAVAIHAGARSDEALTTKMPLGWNTEMLRGHYAEWPIPAGLRRAQDIDISVTAWANSSRRSRKAGKQLWTVTVPVPEELFRDRITAQRWNASATKLSGAIETMNPTSSVHWYRARVQVDSQAEPIEKLHVTIVQGDGIQFGETDGVLPRATPGAKRLEAEGLAALQAGDVVRWKVELPDERPSELVLRAAITAGGATWNQRIAMPVPPMGIPPGDKLYGE